MVSKEAQLRGAKNYRENPNNREKIYARKQVYLNLRAGRLKKEPCWACGNPLVQAHHEDYKKPLEIIWLCKVHHVVGDIWLKNGSTAED